MLDFIKMEGTGNCYIYIDNLDGKIDNYNYSDLAIKMSNFNYGIGSDGLIVICHSNIAHAKMIMYNKDGSEGNMCGNGIRCVAKYIYENVLPKKDLVIETKSGLKNIKINIVDDEIIDITVDMGKPVFDSKFIPVISKYKEIVNKKVKFGNFKVQITCVSIGNPHTVVFVKDTKKTDVEYFGKLIQKSNIFPNQCNVEFVQIVNNNKIKMRVFERGSGETFSCGTGACAAVVAGVLNGYLNKNKDILVELIGGNLKVRYNDTIFLTGPANTICTGKYLVKNVNKK